VIIGFEDEFFEQLNSFKNREDTSVIVVSIHNYRHEKIYKNDELTSSPLED